jgi:sensor histidine kinase YesM
MSDQVGTRTRNNPVIWGLVAWFVIAIAYVIPMLETRPGASLLSALVSSFSHWLMPAILSPVIWRWTARVPWPTKTPVRFTVLHLVSAAVFTSVWFSFDFLMISWAIGLTAALALVKTFQGFQLIDGAFFYFMIAAASYVVRVATRLRAEEARAAQAEALQMRAELSALRGQLNPHFLFNTLHTLTALVRRDPATAESALERFGDMLRYVLDVKRSQREDVTLGDELDFVRTYLTLEHLRLGDRLRVTESIDPDALEMVLPSLTLQPLVENAIKYGIAPRAAGGTLAIRAAFTPDGALDLEVADDGPGAHPGIMESPKGVGLRAVRQRIETRYAGRGAFNVVTAPGQGFVVRVTLPSHTGTHAVPVATAALR